MTKRCTALTESQSRIFEESLKYNHDVLVELSGMKPEQNPDEIMEDNSKLIEEIFNENKELLKGNDGFRDDFIRPDLNRKIKSSGKFTRK